MRSQAILVVLTTWISASLVSACAEAKAKPAPNEEATVSVSSTPSESESKPAAMCGGIAAIPCPSGQFCDYGSHCGMTDQSGLCRPIPGACTDQYLPVCGCDGKTYSNACVAHAAGISVAAEGSCATPKPGPPMPPG